MYRYVSFGLLIAAILLLAFIFYKVMAGFILPLFLAALLVVMFRPVHNWCLTRLRGRQKSAALATTILIMLIVLLPLTLLSFLAAAEGRSLLRQFDAQAIGQKILQLRSSLNLDMPAVEQFDDVKHKIKKIKEFPLTPSAVEIVGLADDYRIAVSEFERASRRVANALVLDWIERFELPADEENADQPSDNSTTGLWASFNRKLVDARSKLESTDWDAANNDGTIHHQFEECQEAARESIEAFDDFRNQLLGGRVWAALKELANPGEQELTDYLDRGFVLLRDQLVSFGPATTAFIVRTLFGMAIMVIALYFFLLDGPAMLKAVKRMSPLDDAYEDQLIEEFDTVSRAVVLATLLSAIVQGVLAAIGFYFAGMHSIFLLMMLTTILALIPFVGAAAVWVPVCLYMGIFEGRLVAAVLLAVYGATIISMADNVIKPLVLHGQSNLHPLWALLSVLGGVSALGPIGILVGPMVVAFLQTTLKILEHELSEMESSANSAASIANDTS